MTIPPILQTISAQLQLLGARAILVGGSVRDHFLNLPIKDYDIEVYGLERFEQLEALLQKFGSVKLVGKSFGVLKFVHEGREYDFAFPRVEKKIGRGHRGFAVEVDGMLDFRSAARRRDFTINAMGYDIEQHLYLDPFGGKKDLEAHILRHIDDNTFIEDPLRLYRGVQFCARFGLTMHPSTQMLCREMAEKGLLEELPKERIFTELRKLLLQSQRPSVGWELIRKLGVLHDFPPLYTLPQDQWQMTLRRLDMMAVSKHAAEKKALVLMLAALCFSCSQEQAALFLEILSDEVKLRDAVCTLVRHHDAIDTIYAADPDLRDTLLRKLATEVTIADLTEVARADYFARYPDAHHYAAGDWILSRASALGVLKSAPAPLLQGRDLIRYFALKPSPGFKDILEKVYTMQLEGKITSKEDALKFVREELL